MSDIKLNPQFKNLNTLIISPKRIIRMLGLVIIWGLIFFITAIILCIFYFKITHQLDIVNQRKRIELIKKSTTTNPHRLIDEDLPDNTPINKIRMIGTHNSYRIKADPLRMFFIKIFAPDEAKKLNYSHQTITEQLNSGIRSFEFDIRLNGSTFECVHVPLIDDRSIAPDFSLALKEISIWSASNPKHIPLFLLLEIKDDFAYLDPSLVKINASHLNQLDSLIRNKLGSNLLTPDEIRRDAASIPYAILSKGWPELKNARGKIIVILHQNEKYRNLFIQNNPSLAGRAMFTCAPEDNPDSCFMVINDPITNAALIKKLIAKGYIIRTRADGDGEYNNIRLSWAIASGAQIISTDYPPSYPPFNGYNASFGDNKTISLDN